MTRGGLWFVGTASTAMGTEEVRLHHRGVTLNVAEPPARYGEMLSVGELLLAKPRSVTTRGKSPAGRPSGNLTMM